MIVELPGYKNTETLFKNSYSYVVRAIREVDGRPVVLKQLVAELPTPGQLSRFSFGYDVLEKFDHPNIVKGLDWLKIEERPVIVLEDTGSIDALSYLKQFPHQQLPVDVFLKMAIQVADALSVIHHQQVIHKDLHPGNILITPETGQVYITDFGLATLLTRERPVLVPAEKIEGVLSYVSPEQTGRMNCTLDYRSDFYTLGITFYHLLAGVPPFRADDALGLVHAHIAKQAKPLKQVRSALPPILSDIVDKLISKSPEDRYQSAMGLQLDLQRCLDSLQDDGSMESFALAEFDVSSSFQLPQTLIGRDKEIDQLMSMFYRAAAGTPCVLSVAGYSGIGKSALVHEIHKPIANQNGLFIAGKFDQYQQNIPYSGLQKAMKGWLQHALSLSDEKLQVLKDKLLAKLGDNARLLIDLVEEFELLLGDLPVVGRLGADETKNRFHLVFLNFIKIISRDRPLVIFIDDIQWADRGTLELLPLLMDTSQSRLLLILAYRDNEVDKFHPTEVALAKISRLKQSNDEFTRISLQPLTDADTRQMLSQAMKLPLGDVKDLALLVNNKTAGNPFFIAEFLKKLYSEGLLNFDLKARRWLWQIEAIADRNVSEHVADLMAENIEQLDSETKLLLQVAVCFGSRFELDLLMLVTGQSLMDVVRLLWPALQMGLILQDGGTWSLGVLRQSTHAQDLLASLNSSSHTTAHYKSSQSSTSESSAPSFFCRFAHDQIVHALYNKMPLLQRQKIHLDIGRAMLRVGARDLSDQYHFDLVEQLNLAIPLITDVKERKVLLQQNLWAAQHARDAAVWHAVGEYCAMAMQLLPDNKWQQEPDVTAELYQLRAESDYLCGQLERSEKYYEALFEHVDCAETLAEICASRAVQAFGRGQLQEGITLGLKGIKLLGFEPVDESNLEQAIAKDYREIESYFQLYDIKQVADSSEMIDQRLLILSRIWVSIVPAFGVLKLNKLADYYTLQGMIYFFAHGRSEVAPLQIILFALYLRDQGQLAQAGELAEFSLKTAERTTDVFQLANFYNLYASYLAWFSRSFSDVIYYHDQGFHIGLDRGENARAYWNLGNGVAVQFSRGANLLVLQETAEAAANKIEKAKVLHLGARGFANLAATLVESRSDALVLVNEDLLCSDAAWKNTAHFPVVLFVRFAYFFWSQQSSEALTLAARLLSIWTQRGYDLLKFDLYFMYALLLQNKRSPLSDEERNHLSGCLTELARYEALNKAVFSHKVFLLNANQLAADHAPIEKVYPCFREAIDDAKNYGFIQYQALGNELLARYFIRNNMSELAEPYLREARFLYHSWGCEVKVQMLNSTYTSIWNNSRIPASRSFSQTESLSSELEASLDLASIMKSAQAISSELDMGKLAIKVLNVIVESVGATTAGFVALQERQPRIIVYVDDQGTQVFEPGIALSEFQGLPSDLVSYVLRSREVINLGDALGENAFLSDPYIMSRQPRSVLALPVNYRDELMGVLYLENTLTLNAFTEGRLDVVNLLVAQAAISFENARLFEQV
ncbi:MAG: AAA family ATPase, partial [Pseudomonadales bacterium]|nr:AAA family ATPase [Pseudomonadales bacterium]